MHESSNDVITDMCISLEAAHVEGIPQYIKKLRDNSSSRNFQDFLLEGKAALMFSRAGVRVTLRESPDLALRFNNEQFYAEVKHFREKEQDRIDDARMSDPNCCVDEFGPYLMRYGNTAPQEGKHAWEQVHSVAISKTGQYVKRAPNILVAASSSISVEDTEIPTAIEMIDEDVRSGKCPGIARLNGILLVLSRDTIPQLWRNVFFYATSSPQVPLGPEVSGLLKKICQG